MGAKVARVLPIAPKRDDEVKTFSQAVPARDTGDPVKVCGCDGTPEARREYLIDYLRDGCEQTMNRAADAVK